jgi:hypothetical protein
VSALASGSSNSVPMAKRQPSPDKRASGMAAAELAAAATPIVSA